jgi:hypothetical protein
VIARDDGNEYATLPVTEYDHADDARHHGRFGLDFPLVDLDLPQGSFAAK